MSFMQRQITRKIEWYEVETNVGTEFVDASIFPNPTLDDLAEYVEGKPESFRGITGHGCRLSAPGYMDCTDWSVFDTVKECEEYLDEYYPEDEEGEAIEA